MPNSTFRCGNCGSSKSELFEDLPAKVSVSQRDRQKDETIMVLSQMMNHLYLTGAVNGALMIREKIDLYNDHHLSAGEAIEEAFKISNLYADPCD